MGITKSGHKDILGFYAYESEGVHFWLSVLNDSKAPGVKDTLTICIDRLKGFKETIASALPRSEVQLCVMHHRNPLKHVASKNQKEFMADLKTIYKAENKETAEYHGFVNILEEKWGKKYPMVIKSWQNNWEDLLTYFKYSGDVRKLIYTTNPVEGFYRQIKKYTKTKGSFTS